jgi:hypothetical protein
MIASGVGRAGIKWDAMGREGWDWMGRGVTGRDKCDGTAREGMGWEGMVHLG